MNKHVIDPTFFYEAIDRFSFDYDFYTKTSQDIDEYGEEVHTYAKNTIKGSLQISTHRRNRKKDGNTSSVEYDFYCKSLYRIHEDDFIYKEDTQEWLIVDSINPIDEWGVRSAHLVSVDLSEYRDLADYVKYLEGEKLV